MIYSVHGTEELEMTNYYSASVTLAEAEATASDQQHRAQRFSKAYHHSAIYPAGSEFALCLAESQLMSAVVGVLNESVTESLKGFYKLRKAYVTLEGIADAERKALAELGHETTTSTARTSLSSAQQSQRAQTSSSFQSSGPTRDAADDSDSDEFFDADEAPTNARTSPAYLGHLDVHGRRSMEGAEIPSNKFSGLSLNPTAESSYNSALLEQSEPDIFEDNPVDSFTHSGTNLCFGILLLLLSLIPPTFAALLKIVGFKGDRQRGIELLWKATRYNNINGAFAGLVLLGYYNGIVGFCDILPQTGVGAYPRDRCRALLAQMRSRYPKSRLWLLEEARMLAGDRRLDEAVELLNDHTKSQLKQVEALQWFERSLDCMYLHRYEDCSTSFRKVSACSIKRAGACY